MLAAVLLFGAAVAAAMSAILLMAATGGTARAERGMVRASVASATIGAAMAAIPIIGGML